MALRLAQAELPVRAARPRVRAELLRARVALLPALVARAQVRAAVWLRAPVVLRQVAVRAAEGSESP